jgi:predicted PurR-regulated permease PerM
VHPVIVTLAAYGWRLIIIAAAGIGVFWALSELWVLVLTVVVALYLVRVLDAPNRWLRSRGLPPAAAALTCVGLFIAGVGLLGWLLVPVIAEEFSELGPTLSQATDDVERWLIEDSPFDIEQADLDRWRESATDAASEAAQSSSDSIVSGAIAFFELLTGLILALVTAFFMLKDGPRFQRWTTGHFPTDRQPLVVRLGRRAWTTLGGYLKGVGILGTLEGAVLGITIALVGADLAWPVAIITLLAAFVPIVGAIVAGIIAVLVALATSGVQAALVVAVVAVVVQQLDNDLLAPVIYGRSLQLHPLAVLFSVVAGGALFGLGGTILAVPFTAVVINVLAEARQADDEHDDDADTDPPDLVDLATT